MTKAKASRWVSTPAIKNSITYHPKNIPFIPRWTGDIPVGSDAIISLLDFNKWAIKSSNFHSFHSNQLIKKPTISGVVISIKDTALFFRIVAFSDTIAAKSLKQNLKIYHEIPRPFISGYNGSICATHFGVTVPPISVQFVPVISVWFVPLSLVLFYHFVRSSYLVP